MLTGALLVPVAASAQSHVDNPFVGASGYVNPDYSKEVDSSIVKVKDVQLKAKMQVVKSYPTYVWLDSIDAIYGGSRNAGRLSLQGHLNAALAQKRPIRRSPSALSFTTCRGATAMRWPPTASCH